MGAMQPSKFGEDGSLDWGLGDTQSTADFVDGVVLWDASFVLPKIFHFAAEDGRWNTEFNIEPTRCRVAAGPHPHVVHIRAEEAVFPFDIVRLGGDCQVWLG